LLCKSIYDRHGVGEGIKRDSWGVELRRIRKDRDELGSEKGKRRGSRKEEKRRDSSGKQKERERDEKGRDSSCSILISSSR